MKIGIVGLGLIGGSFAKAFQKTSIWEVYGQDTDRATVDKAVRHGEILGELTDELTGQCDVMIVALYPQDTVMYVHDNGHLFKEGAIVMDCCGIKEEICPVLKDYADKNGFVYIGADPFAGKNECGYDSSSSTLFTNAKIILTPDKDTPAEKLNTLRIVLASAGFGGILEMSPGEHDRVIALTSQLTHIISNALVQSPTAGSDKSFFSGSFRDLVQRADMNERMWSQVFVGNKKYLTKEIDHFVALLEDYKNSIANGNTLDLQGIMQEGKAKKAEVVKNSIITVSASKNYNILVDEGLLDKCGEEIRKRFAASQVMVVTDDTVDRLYGARVEASLEKSGFTVNKYVFRHGETSKTFNTLIPLVEKMAELAMTRTDLIVALGGGVTGDMAGFAAAVYLRGIPFVQIPTTLLAAVDSSIGGKTAVDLGAGKNLAGVFNQPSLVICDYATLYSLPEEEFSTGMAEVIKHGVLADRELFDFVAEHDAKKYLGDIIPKNLAIKRNHVMADEFDTGARQLLNLGHTLAHAVEKLSNYEINHGNAVSIGLAAVCKASYAYGLTEENITDEVVSVLKKYHLMTECPFTAAEACRVILNDKKRAGQKITLAIPRRIGECYLYKMDVDRLEEFYRLAIG